MTLGVAILGPTASGKSRFALELASVLGGEILNLDATAVYRYFDIGSAKPTLKERETIPHHLVDVADPDSNFSAHDFIRLAQKSMEEITHRGKICIAVGGSYFYFRALQRGMFEEKIESADIFEIERKYTENGKFNNAKAHADLKQADPQTALRVFANDRYRLTRALAYLAKGYLPSQLTVKQPTEQIHWVKYAMVLPYSRLVAKISQRSTQMIEEGILEETAWIWKNYPSARGLGAVGYAECVKVLQGVETSHHLDERITQKTKKLAKKQMTWLRSDTKVRYIDSGDFDRVCTELNIFSGLIKKGKNVE